MWMQIDNTVCLLNFILRLILQRAPQNEVDSASITNIKNLLDVEIDFISSKKDNEQTNKQMTFSYINARIIRQF